MKHLFFILSAFFILNGCQREDFILEEASMVGQPQVTVFGSLVGLITDDSGNLVDGATVSLGNHVTHSNEFGVFEFQDILMPEEGAYVQVKKVGYFNGSRSFSTELNQTPYVRVELINKDVIDYVDTNVGGEVEIGNTKVNLPAGEYRLQDGSIYSGELEVYATYLDPTVRETYKQMPGELSGINKEDEVKALASYGTIGFELTNAAGENVSLPNGEEAVIWMNVPASLISSAPNSIALWYFDELDGIWKEEGTASLVVNGYVGRIKNLSFWNFSEPYNAVDLNGIVLIQDEPYVGAEIKITDLNSGTYRFGTSGEQGFFKGKVPAGSNLLLEILDLCGDGVYELSLGSLSDDLDVATIEIEDGNVAGVELVSVSGILFNCEEENIEQGYVVVSNDEINFIIAVEEDGSFNAEIPACSPDELVEVYGVDLSNDILSFPEYGPLNELNDLFLFACDEFLTEPGYEIFYESQNWQSVGDENVQMTIGVDSIVDGMIVLEYTIIDPSVYNPAEGVQCYATFLLDPTNDEIEYMLQFESQGFSISGITFKDIEIVNGEEVCSFNGYSSDILVFDASKFPGNVSEVNFIIWL